MVEQVRSLTLFLNLHHVKLIGYAPGKAGAQHSWNSSIGPSFPKQLYQLNSLSAVGNAIS